MLFELARSRLSGAGLREVILTPRLWWSEKILRSAGFTPAVGIVIICSLFLLQIYQHVRVGTIIGAYAQADHESQDIPQKLRVNSLK